MQHREAIQLHDLHEEASAWKADNEFTTEEIGAALNHMQVCASWNQMPRKLC